MNKPHKDKKKFTYFEHGEVMTELKQMAKENAAREGQHVSIPALIRGATLKVANEHRKSCGKKPIVYDPSAGKFAPAGSNAATLALVYANGQLEVYDKRGKRMDAYKSVAQMAQLLRHFPKCRIVSK